MSSILRSSLLIYSRYVRWQPLSSSSGSSRERKRFDVWGLTLPLFMLPLLQYDHSHDHTAYSDFVDEECGASFNTDQSLCNWSATHSCNPARVYEPSSTQEVSRVLKMFHDKSGNIRPIGKGLSPNGIAFVSNDPSTNDSSMMSLSSIDHIKVDAKRQLVTVGAGATVASVLKELKNYGLTLQNFSSITEQQIGGWTQVAAHGTGCSFSTVDEMIVKMTLAIPTGGIIPLSNDNYPELFNMAKVGLGSLGVVTELTLKCVPLGMLEEEIKVFSHNNISHDHFSRLKSYRHMKYLWIPHTDNVVSIMANPINLRPKATLNSETNSLHAQPMIDLLTKINPMDLYRVGNKTIYYLRDLLISYSPRDTQHIKAVNNAEAASWKSMQGKRVDLSTNILGFECGGQQLVLEVCFPIGSLENNSGKDIEFVKKLLKVISDQGIPAPSPVEQRWTASSSSPMSPAYSKSQDEVFSWVGIIMYLPANQTPEQRNEIARTFKNYCRAIKPLVDEYGAQYHWAKIELPEDADGVKEMRELVRRKYPVKEFNRLRKILDPNGVLSNNLISTLFDE